MEHLRPRLADRAHEEVVGHTRPTYGRRHADICVLPYADRTGRLRLADVYVTLLPEGLGQRVVGAEGPRDPGLGYAKPLPPARQ